MCKQVEAPPVSRASLLLWLRDAGSYPDAHSHLAALRPGEAYKLRTDAGASIAEQHSGLRATRHQRRAIPFGPWSISPIVASGEFISWGANCGKHFNSWEPHLRCKTSCAFKGGRMPPGEARIRMKMWLLAGHDIEQSKEGEYSDARHQHFDVSFMSMPLEDEAELDRHASLVAAM